jgi:hypothetical protein
MLDEGREEFDGACHCGAVRFHVKLAGGLASARRCTCSYCRMRGAVALSAWLGDFEVTSGADKLTLYQFNTRIAKHYFCSICGIYTHHQRRSNPEQFGINASCLQGISPFDFDEVIVTDGVNHSRDVPRNGRTGIVGTLKFIRCDPS